MIDNAKQISADGLVQMPTLAAGRHAMWNMIARLPCTWDAVDDDDM